VINGVIAF